MKKYIYKITNLINQKAYIGQTTDYKRRFTEHKAKGYGWEDNKILYYAFDKYGINNFSFEVLEETENYDEREKYWIEYYNTMKPNGYNMIEGGSNPPVFRGEEHHLATHSLNEIQIIINLLKNTDIPTKQIAEMTNYNHSSINRINIGELWKQENIEYPIRKENTKSFKEERAENIINDLLNTKMTQKQIAQKYGVGRTTVTAINNGQNHKKEGLKYPLR